MKVLIIGAAGMIGRKLTARLVARRTARRAKRSTQAHLVDIVAPEPPAERALPGRGRRLRHRRVLCRAETDRAPAGRRFSCSPRWSRAKRRRISTRATPSISAERRRCSRRSGASRRSSGGAYRPRLIFTSSIAVFGAPFPDKIGDEFLTAPLTSYGTQKAICELAARRLFAARLLRRDRPPAADDLRSARRAEQGGVGVLLRHHPRAARGQGGDPAGRR